MERTNGHSKRVNVERDRFELELLHAALERNMSVLAVCRGMQLLAAALGGKLYQDISELPPDAPSGEFGVHRIPGHEGNGTTSFWGSNGTRSDRLHESCDDLLNAFLSRISDSRSQPGVTSVVALLMPLADCNE